MAISIEQIKAGRALLNWNQADLASTAGLNIDQIRNFESGRTRSLDVIEAIQGAFGRHGIDFENGGVMPRQIHSYILKSYLELLTDISRTLPTGGEVLMHCEDDRLCDPPVIEKLKDMNAEGITERLTISSDIDLILRDKENYRKIPAKYFSKSEVMVIYNNKVAFFSGGSAVVIVNTNLSQHMRDQFEYWWDHGEKIK